MHANPHLEHQILELQGILPALQRATTYVDKLAFLNTLPVVQEYINNPHPLENFLKNLTPEAEYAIKSVIAIGQGPLIFNRRITVREHINRLIQLLEQLLEIEIFYRHMGGIIGYHLRVISLIVDRQTSAKISGDTRYIHPNGLDLGQDLPSTRAAVRWGIEDLKKMAMIYPMGGAGDRLHLTDDAAAPLPVACLPFLGRTLLEGLIRDLAAMEYLYFKLFGQQLVTPIAIMTSVEKNNHTHILSICKERQWFGRPSDSFYFFMQPVVPVITIEGNWSLVEPLTLALKPCGHGVLWKLAEEQGVFQWLESKKRRQCLIRQINNPVAGTDNTLLGLIGVGCRGRKAFGFASCARLLNSDEGTDVLIEKKERQGYDYCLTNIEYTDFSQKGIGELSAGPGSPFSLYPTNTNILFADIRSIRKILRICPIPGQLINMKSEVSSIDADGRQTFISGGRLESTMQNIADFIIDHFPCPLESHEHQRKLRTFIVYNERSKTISTTKKTYQPGKSPISTPEQAYYDLLTNHCKLFQHCQFELPEWTSMEEYLDRGPACILLFHPALGPLYSVIAQKIRRGRLIKGAELQLEIAEIDIEELFLEGSLLIEAVPPLGTYDPLQQLQYDKGGRCTLKRIAVRNLGIDRAIQQSYWKNDLKRHQAMKILLHEGAEFHAEDLSLEGPHCFEVPPHHRLVLHPDSDGRWTEELTPLAAPTWHWRYAFDSQEAIQIKKMEIPFA